MNASYIPKSLLAFALATGCTILPGTAPSACSEDSECEDFFGPGSACQAGGTCSDPTGTKSLQVGLLYVGPVGDHGWTKTHDEGRAYMLGELDDVTAMFAPSVSATDAPARIEEFVARGDNVIIATSFDFLVPIQAAALDHPDLQFLLVNGFQTGPNLGSYSGRMYQVMYQAGYLAGKMSQSGLVGVVGSVAIPEVVSHTNAFARGVQAANPEGRVMMRWVDAWFDPPTETAAANELVDAGCDVIMGQTDTTIPIETANMRSTSETPILTIGYDNADSCSFAPETCMTSAYWSWGPVLTDILRRMQNGSWDPTEYIWTPMLPDPAESVVYLSPISDSLVPSAIRIEVEGLVDDLSTNTPEGRMFPFRGGVLDSMGTRRFAAGEFPSDHDILTMCWFVDGVLNTDGTPAEVPNGCPGEY